MKYEALGAARPALEARLKASALNSAWVAEAHEALAATLTEVLAGALRYVLAG